MSSQDGSQRQRRPQRAASERTQPGNSGQTWDVDPAELDRYLSGQPSREQRFDPYGRQQSTTRQQAAPARQPQQRPSRSQSYGQPAEEEIWDDDAGYDEEVVTYTAHSAEEYHQDDAQWAEDWLEDPEPGPVRPRRAPVNRQSRQPRAAMVSDDEGLYNDDPFLGYEHEEPVRPQRREQQQKPSQRRQATQRSQRPRKEREPFQMPTVISQDAALQDQRLLIMLGVTLLSVIAMCVIVATQNDGIGTWVVTHVNANGDADRVETSQALWRLPLIAGMVTLISTLGAWYLAKFDGFLSRFLLGGAIVVNFLLWIPIVRYFF